MMIRTSFRGLVIWFVSTGLVALIGLASVRTDEVCGDWGYVVKDSLTCEESGGIMLARIAGIACLLAGLSLAWAVFKARKAVNDHRTKW